jgi:hypothetical protein
MYFYHSVQTAIHSRRRTGTDVMIFNVFSPKNLAKNGVFTQNKAKF